MTRSYEFVKAQPQEVAAEAGPHAWIQWKGTDVCADIHCACGAHLHLDADFAYAVQCPHCLARYAMPCSVPIYRLPDGFEWDGCEPCECQPDLDLPTQGVGDA